MSLNKHVCMLCYVINSTKLINWKQGFIASGATRWFLINHVPDRMLHFQFLTPPLFSKMTWTTLKWSNVIRKCWSNPYGGSKYRRMSQLTSDRNQESHLCHIPGDNFIIECGASAGFDLIINRLSYLCSPYGSAGLLKKELPRTVEV